MRLLAVRVSSFRREGGLRGGVFGECVGKCESLRSASCYVNRIHPLDIVNDTVVAGQLKQERENSLLLVEGYFRGFFSHSLSAMAATK